MNKSITYILLLFFLMLGTLNGFAQKKNILGKVVAKTRDLEGIYVKNTNLNTSALTQKGGYFFY